MSSPPHDPLRPHRHEPNLRPPSDDATITLVLPDATYRVELAELRALPLITLPDCFIVSTGHGTSGPFAFGGARLIDLITRALPAKTCWREAAVLSADGFGTRVTRAELDDATITRPMLLSYLVNGRALTREAGLVRLIDPGEAEAALRQVKWVAQIHVS